MFVGVSADAVGGGERKSKSYSMPRSCAEARSADPTLQSGNYYVDPDGTNVGDEPIYVYCDMQTGNIKSIHGRHDIRGSATELFIGRLWDKRAPVKLFPRGAM